MNVSDETEEVSERGSSAGAERRRFTRVSFINLSKIHQGGHLWNVDVVDISLKGAMVTKPVHWSLNPDQPCRLELHLGRDDAVVDMRMRVAYEGEHRLGLECEEIDIDSLTFLRNIIDANSEGRALAERELSELIAARD